MIRILKLLSVSGLLACVILLGGCSGGGDDGGSGAPPAAEEPVVNVDVQAANAAQNNPYNASNAKVVFAVHPISTFTYNVSNFAAGDRIIFDDGAAVNLINTNGTDGIIDIVGTLNGQVATIHLTGIAAASDSAVSSIASFNITFGPGSLVWASGDIGSPLAVQVSAANTQPYNASAGIFVFNVHPTSTFTYNIGGFAAGDRLVFDSGTAIGLTNASGTDGILDVIGTLSGQAATIRLTGLDPASDAAIFGVNSFNSVFGPSSLVTQ
ncbi:MAG: hypothetical protein JW943_16150 [Deltaproteobacteria bacterium]|nr:hypothetical protein [Deltaproteobacteria bacterium]